MRGILILSLALVLAAASSASAAGTVIYTDFGNTGTGFQAGSGWAITGSSPVVAAPANEAIGADFTVSAVNFPSGVNFGSVTLAIGEFPNFTVKGAGTVASPATISPGTPEYGTDSFKITLTTSSSGEPSAGAALETWDNVALSQIVPTIANPTTSKTVTYSSPTLTLDSTIFGLKLNAGQTYWITVAPEAASATAVWCDTTLPGAIDPAIGSIGANSITWSDNGRIAPAFSVNAPLAPAPASIPGGLVLMAGLFGAKWFRKATAK